MSDAKLAMLDAQGFHSIAQRFMRRSEAALRIVQYANQRPGIKGAKNRFEPKRKRGKIEENSWNLRENGDKEEFRRCIGSCWFIWAETSCFWVLIMKYYERVISPFIHFIILIAL